MSDESNVASATDTPAPAPEAKPELKSTDTGVLATLKPKADTAPPPKAEKPEAKPASDATPAVKGPDADSAADHPDDDDRADRKIEPWMKKRLARAEEKGRKQARAEILDEIRTLKSAPTDQPKADPKAQPEAPKTLADFQYDIEKYNAYAIREGVKQALAERDAENDRQRKEQTAREAQTAFEKRKAEFESRVGEGAWDEMVSAKVDVPQQVIDLLMGHERDLDIAHYLINNPDALDKLRGKSNLVIARELAAIETKLSGSSEQELPPKTTKAPPPPPKVTGAGKSVKSIAEMSTAERIAEWRRQKQQRQAS